MISLFSLTILSNTIVGIFHGNLLGAGLLAFVLAIILGMGLIFEMPILVFFLALMGIVSAGWMWKNFRYSILVIFIIAAIVTPTTDILNMCIFAAPMIALYLASIGVAWAVHPKTRRARREKNAQ